MTFTEEESERLTYPEWEQLIVTLETAIEHTVDVHQPGYEAMADELLDVKSEIATEIIPSWADTTTTSGRPSRKRPKRFQ